LGVFCWRCFHIGRTRIYLQQNGKSRGLPAGIVTVIFIVIIHIPNYLEAGNKEMRSMAFINILKDLAIAGFALHIAAGAHHQKLHLEDSD
jgi:hypothetical protein